MALGLHSLRIFEQCRLLQILRNLHAQRSRPDSRSKVSTKCSQEKLKVQLWMCTIGSTGAAGYIETTNSIGFSKTELDSSMVFYEGHAHELLNSNNSDAVG